jgi:hypothetical protein
MAYISKMQKYLNDEAKYFLREFRRNPIIPVIILSIELSAVAMIVISINCNISYPCTNDQMNYTLFFGLIISTCTISFVAIPCFIRFLLNCIYRKKHNSRHIRGVINRKLHSPPYPYPRHALKSFRETFSI